MELDQFWCLWEEKLIHQKTKTEVLWEQSHVQIRQLLIHSLKFGNISANWVSCALFVNAQTLSQQELNTDSLMNRSFHLMDLA